MQWVPPERRAEIIPCRQISLGTAEETLDSLYGYGDQREIEVAVGNWLRAAIERMEGERRVHHRDESKLPTSIGDAMKGTPLYENLHPKCANPACSVAFHWLGGGKFFRFRPNQLPTSTSTSDSSSGRHGVKNFWFCEHCSRIFTLVYQEEYGAVLKLLRPELPPTEPLNVVLHLGVTSKGGPCEASARE